MHWDFWNNPLVVSALRVKYRRSSPAISACLYVLALVSLGILLAYNKDNLSVPFARTYLMAILGIQFALSGLICLVTVSISMNAEVNNRTLDFQRIVSLSPREILVGKMIGEPALSYFLAMSTVPLVILCWFQGAAVFPAIGLFYVNLLSFMVMCASIGLLHTLAEPNQTAGRPRSGGIGGLLFIPLAFLPSMIVQSHRMLSDPWWGAIVNLLTPIGPILELRSGDPFAAVVQLWGLPLPALMLAPLAQFAIAAWFLQAMSRRLKKSLQPVFGRRDVYIVLAVVDLLVAGVCFTKWQSGELADQLVAQFCLAHLVTCLLLLFGATPSRAALMTWLWRFRGQQSWSGDSLGFSRAEITLALAAMCAIGAALLLIGFVLPVAAASRGGPTQFDGRSMAEVLLVTCLLILASGMMCQWCQAVLGKSGLVAFACVVLILNIAPPILASLMQWGSGTFRHDAATDLVFSFSPIVYFVSRIGSGWGYPLPSLPLVIGYLLLAWIAHSSFRTWRNQKAATVAAKIKEMGAAVPT